MTQYQQSAPVFTSILGILGFLLVLSQAFPSDVSLAEMTTAEPTLPDGPRIVLLETEVDYGELLQGEVIEKEFRIKNEGDAVLNIWRAIPSCGCTKMIDFPRTLKPGAIGTVKFEIDSKKIAPGDTRKGITLENNDPEQSKIRFIFKTKITSLFKTNPNPIRISGLFSETKKANVRLLATTNLGFNVLGARSRNGEFEITDFQEVTKDGEYLVEITVPPSANARTIKDPLDLMIEVKDGRSVVVGRYVEIFHLDAVLVRPESVIQFGNRDTDKLLKEDTPGVITKVVQLQSIDEALDFKVLDATLDGFPEGVLDVDVVEVVPGKTYKVELTLTEYRKEPILRGKLTIETNDPRKELRVLQVAAKFGRL